MCKNMEAELPKGVSTSLLEDKTQMTEDSLSLHEEEIFVDEMSSDIDIDEIFNDEPIFVKLNNESGIHFSEVNGIFDEHFCNFEMKTECPELPDFNDCLDTTLDDACVLTLFNTHPLNEDYECNNCKRKYKYKKGLIQHFKLQCGTDPKFVCEFCGLLFRHKASLKKHVFLYHSLNFKSWFAEKYDVKISKVPVPSERKQKLREYETLIKIRNADLSPKCRKSKRPRNLQNNEAVANKSKGNRMRRIRGTGMRHIQGTGIRRGRGSPQIRESGKTQGRGTGMRCITNTGMTRGSGLLKKNIRNPLGTGLSRGRGIVLSHDRGFGISLEEALK